MKQTTTMVNPSAIITALMMLFLAMFGTACSARDNFQPMYLITVSSPEPFDAAEKEKNRIDSNEYVDPTPEQLQVCSEVIEQISKKYPFTKPQPKIKTLSNVKFNRSSSIVGTSMYDNMEKVILIPQSFGEADKSSFCHEFFHYLSDYDESGKVIGFEKFLNSDTDTYLFGKSLNEGVTNYFSTKLYPHDKTACVYEFETHVASMLALSFGEEELWKAYSTGNLDELKKAFNEACKNYPFSYYDGIDLSPFEQMELMLDEYQFLLLNIEKLVQDHSIEEFMYEFNTHVLSVDEMLLHYADRQGKSGEAKSKMRSLIVNSSDRLDFEALYCLI